MVRVSGAWGAPKTAYPYGNECERCAEFCVNRRIEQKLGWSAILADSWCSTLAKMTLNNPVDQYTFELEISNGAEANPFPVHVIATNTHDRQTAELHLSLEQTREQLLSIMDAFRGDVEWYQHGGPD